MQRCGSAWLEFCGLGAYLRRMASVENSGMLRKKLDVLVRPRDYPRISASGQSRHPYMAFLRQDEDGHMPPIQPHTIRTIIMDYPRDYDTPVWYAAEQHGRSLRRFEFHGLMMEFTSTVLRLLGGASKLQFMVFDISLPSYYPPGMYD